MTDTHILVLGGGQIGRRLAEDLTDHPATGDVGFVDGSETAVETARSNGVTATHAPVTDTDSTAVETARDAEIVILTGDNDGMNLLLAQRLRLRDADIDLVVLVNDPRNRDAFDELDVDTICVAETTAAALDVRVSALTTAKENADSIGDSPTRGAVAEGSDRSTDRMVR